MLSDFFNLKIIKKMKIYRNNSNQKVIIANAIASHLIF